MAEGVPLGGTCALFLCGSQVGKVRWAESGLADSDLRARAEHRAGARGVVGRLGFIAKIADVAQGGERFARGLDLPFGHRVARGSFSAGEVGEPAVVAAVTAFGLVVDGGELIEEFFERGEEGAEADPAVVVPRHHFVVAGRHVEVSFDQPGGHHAAFGEGGAEFRRHVVPSKK